MTHTNKQLNRMEKRFKDMFVNATGGLYSDYYYQTSEITDFIRQEIASARKQGKDEASQHFEDKIDSMKARIIGRRDFFGGNGNEPIRSAFDYALQILNEENNGKSN